MDIEAALLDLYTYRLRRVGRRNMTNYELWRGWLEYDDN